MGQRTLWMWSLLGCLLGMPSSGRAQPPAEVEWRTLTTVEDVCRVFPARVRALFAALDLDRPGLDDVKAAVTRKEYPAACTALIAYYRAADTAGWLRVETPKPGEGRTAAGEKVLDDTFTIQQATARQPRTEAGGLDWVDMGPNRDNQWVVFLHRHFFFRSLLAAWRETGNPRYPAAFDALLRDWVTHHTAPEKRLTTPPWTPLNPGIRLGDPWPRAFFGFQQADAFTAAGRILFLCSLREQTEYLLRTLTPGHNFATMQLNGLGMTGLAFPEFRAAGEWADLAERELTRELTAQVYQDGAQKELAVTYHLLTVSNFEGFARHAREAGRPLGPTYTEGLARMWDYVAGVMLPDGTLPPNNDSDVVNVRSRVLAAAKRFSRADWQYIATGGAEGTRPADPPSRFFPWAGQLVTRSGWDAEAHWGFFDVGPWGTSHQHNDMLHLSVAAHGRDLLVDSGRFAYSGAIASTYRVPYAFHSRGHNVILVDGLGQCATEQEATAPHDDARITPHFDYCRATFDAGFSKEPSTAITMWLKTGPAPNVVDIAATHTRAVVYLRGLGWLVADRVAADRPRTLTPLWHFHPDCTVAVEGASAVTTDAGKGNLRITPIGDIDWQVRVVKGQFDPVPQGWYSPVLNVVRESPCVEYTAQAPATALFGWWLTPGKGEVPRMAVERLPAPEGALRVRLTPPDSAPIEVAVRLAGDAPVPLSGGLTLEGACAVLLPGQPPQSARGRILDAAGRVIHDDTMP